MFEVNDKGFILKNININDYTKAKTQIIQEFLNEGKAFQENDNFIIPHEIVSKLTSEEVSILEFPEFYPFGIKIESYGKLTDNYFRYNYYFVDPNLVPFANPKIIGCYIEINEEQKYILPYELFVLKKEMDDFNLKVSCDSKYRSKIIENNYLKFSKIKELSTQTGVFLDKYLNSERVIFPKKIAIVLDELVNNQIKITPIICREDKKEEDDDEKVLIPLDENKEFLEQFEKLERVKKFYTLKDNTTITFEDNQLDELKKIKKLRYVSKETLKKIPEILNQDVIDFETPILIKGKKVYWSERVKEIGVYEPKPITFPFTDDKIRPKVEIEGRKGKRKKREKVSSKLSLKIKDNISLKEYIKENVKKRSNDIYIPYNRLKNETKLLPHQKEGIRKLQELYVSPKISGCLLADDMGLGKTLQTLVFLAWTNEIERKKNNQLDPILIIAPVTLIKNWIEEYEKFLKPLWGPFWEIYGNRIRNFKKSDIQFSTKISTEIELSKLPEDELKKMIENEEYFLLDLSIIGKGEIAITTYETVRNYQFSFAKKDWSIVVVDEAQKMKNPTSMISNTIKALKYDFAIAITGTPVENSWVDLWNIMDFIQPGYFGSLSEFSDKFITPIKNKNADIRELGKELKGKIDNFMIRRLKEDILEGLPPKNEKIYKKEMPEIQLKTYNSAITSFQKGLDIEYMIQIILKLREISLHPYIYKFSLDYFEKLTDKEIINSSARFQVLIQTLDKIKKRNEKVVIFLENKKLQKILRRIIMNRYNLQNEVFIINGETRSSLRNEFIKKFQEIEGFHVIILSPLAAGVGITITEANNVIHLSRLWNPAKEDQATDRVYRIGQKKEVFVHIPITFHHKLISEPSFDEQLHNLLERKRELSKTILFPPTIGKKELIKEFGELKPKSEIENGQKINLNFIDNLPPDDFEEFITKLFIHLNYSKVETTPKSGDMGADIIVIDENKGNLLIQCKHVKNPNNSIDPKAVREIVTAKNYYEHIYKCSFQLLVITNSLSFTPSAKAHAKFNNVKLISRKELKILLNESNLSLEKLLY